jgi:CxxC-x17-CxxC domain-containing protein
MEYQDQTIICSDCSQEFNFTAGEQQFYAERGFEHPPKRCKPCRGARKQQQSTRPREGAPQAAPAPREAGSTPTRPRESSASPNQRPREAAPRPRQQRDAAPRALQPRDVHVTTCQACGVTTRVPFKPQEGRGVYCPECYQALKALARSSNDEESL